MWRCSLLTRGSQRWELWHDHPLKPGARANDWSRDDGAGATPVPPEGLQDDEGDSCLSGIGEPGWKSCWPTPS
eukprot:s4250_g1.t1